MEKVDRRHIVEGCGPRQGGGSSMEADEDYG